MKWKVSLSILMAFAWFSFGVADHHVYAQQVDDEQEQEATENADEDDDNFVPTETINVDSEISFPVDI